MYNPKSVRRLIGRNAFLVALVAASFSPLLTGCGTAQTKPADTSTAQGIPGPAGPPGIVYRKTYDPTVQYATADAVTYQRSTYLALASTIDIPPVGTPQSAAKWSLLAGAGGDGAPGATGSQGPTGPTGPTGPQGQEGPVGQDRTSFLTGKRFFVLGDSISSLATANKEWQKVVVTRTGMVPTYTDAVPGRRLPQAFECYGAARPGAALGSYSAAIQPLCTSDGGKEGATLTENLADADVAIIELGTNDETEPVGHYGDEPTGNTSEGTLRWIVETVESAKPTIRVVVITPEFNNRSGATSDNIKALVEAETEYAEGVGVPVINMLRLGGVNATNMRTLLGDGIHPTKWNYDNIYGPVVAQQLMQIF